MYLLQLVKQAVVPRVHALALKTTVAAVRVNSLLCLGELIHTLDKQGVLDVLQTMQRCTAIDPSQPTLMCSLSVANAVLKQAPQPTPIPPQAQPVQSETVVGEQLIHHPHQRTAVGDSLPLQHPINEKGPVDIEIGDTIFEKSSTPISPYKRRKKGLFYELSLEIPDDSIFDLTFLIHP